MNIIKNKKIAIIGGGPGGLTLARILQMNGAEVNVYERDLNKDARLKGATLDLHDESGLKAIRAAGLMDEFIANYRPGADKMRVVDEHGKIVLEDNDPKEGAHFRPEIDRGPLQEILLNSLQPGTVVWDSQVVSLLPHGDSWKLEFKNGKVVTADIVIAADGANSKIRKHITTIKPFYSGITVIECSIKHSETATPKIHELLNGGKIFALGMEKSLIVSSKGDGSLVFYPGFKADENWVRECGIDFSDKLQVLAWFKSAYKGWDSMWDELFENMTSDAIVRPQYCMPFDQTWAALPNLTMIGDAAHLMPPYAGEGVNMAMLDGLELGECLSGEGHPDVLSAIAAYEKQMRARASETAKMTMMSTEALHGANSISFILEAFSGHD